MYFTSGAGDYWMPAFAVMTNSSHDEPKNDGELK